MDVLESPAAQCFGNDDAAGSVQRSIDDVQVLLAVDDLLVNHGFLHGLQVIPVHFAADDLDEVGVALELHVFYLHLVHLIDDTRVVGCQHLCAVFPVSLVAIVLFRVVGGGDVHAGLSSELPDGEGDFGRGTQALEEIDLDAVGREDVCHGLGVFAAVVAAVVTNDHAEVLAA